MPNNDRQFDTGRPAKDAQMRGLQKIQGFSDRSRKPGPDTHDPTPPTFPGPVEVPSNNTATDKR